jgi:hypothetical protein
MLAKSFAQKTNSNSKKKEMNCSQNCNSKLPLRFKGVVLEFTLEIQKTTNARVML